MNPRIVEATPTDDYKIALRFTNGELGVYDCSSLLDFGVFQELRDKNYFKRVKVLGGATVLPNEQDICPDTLYLHTDRNVSFNAPVSAELNA